MTGFASMKVLIVDNDDSFTFNLSQLVAKVAAREPLVVSNTEDNWLALIAKHAVEAIVISPGPGTPERPSDFGTCVDLIRQATVPLLGVCLGHQGLGHAYGARVVRAPVPMHGRVTKVSHDGNPLFEGIPRSFDAVRYHSLCLERESVPPCLKVTATTADGVPMALGHRVRPQFGVQFHPESVAAEFGEQLMRNFLRIASCGERLSSRLKPARATRRIKASCLGGEECYVAFRTLDQWINPQQAFETLFARSQYSFWLDSSAVIPGYSRFSMMGDASGPGDEVLRYRTAERSLQIGPDETANRKPSRSFVSEIRSRLARRVRRDASLPFDFQTGLVGYIGYEMRNEFGTDSGRVASLPDAAFIDSSRCLVFDHADQRVFLVARCETPARDPEPWFDFVTESLGDRLISTRRPRPAGGKVVATLADGPGQYLAKVRDCQDELAAGESYQICLSSEFTVSCDVSPYDAYRELRAINPAPYSAYLRFGDFAVLSSSPERFLQVSADRIVSAKPIKGTAERGVDQATDASLAEWLIRDEKSRSENLMIVDLLRNDVGRVASAGSVRVPKLMDVESYTTVHQLVSTVTGHLRQDRDCVDCLVAAFPGGSMTGAPKVRTMSIIDRLEGRARGPYSGALGFLSYGDRMDLSIVIRTIVIEPSRVTVASGGGIVALSDPRSEFDEMILKARAPLRALAAASAGDPRAWRIRHATP